MAGQSQSVEPMPTVGDKSVKKLFVTAAIIGLKDKNIQEMSLLRLFVSKDLRINNLSISHLVFMDTVEPCCVYIA